MYESKERTEYKGENSFSPSLRYWTRVRSSAKIERSRIRGVAKRES